MRSMLCVPLMVRGFCTPLRLLPESATVARSHASMDFGPLRVNETVHDIIHIMSWTVFLTCYITYFRQNSERRILNTKAGIAVRVKIFPDAGITGSSAA